MSFQLDLFPDPPVTLESKFEEIFHLSMPPKLRRDRWAQWLRIARSRKYSHDAAEMWTDHEACVGCKHLRGRAWCTLQNLPCTVNPYLSFRTGMIGMACMGGGYEEAAA